jgi:hypothetical protein
MGSTLRRYRAAAAVCAVLQVALSFALTADLVLCRTAAGHVEIESASAGDCCDSHGLFDRLREAYGADDCGCVDTPLLQTPLDQRWQPTGASSALSHAVHLPATLLPAPATRLEGLARLRPRPPLESLTAIRSVVLLV